jgi:HEAT repeat protein
MDAPRSRPGNGKRTALWVLALGLVLIPAVAFALREHLLVEWCYRRITDAQPYVALDAAVRLAEVRTVRAAEGLLRGLEHDTLPVRNAAAEGLGRARAADRRAALDRLGDRARAAVPGLCEAVKNARSLEARIAAAEALARFACDDEAVRLALIGTAENEREDLAGRIAALDALDCSGIAIELIAPALAALAEEADPLGALARVILEDDAAAGGR